MMSVYLVSIVSMLSAASSSKRKEGDEKAGHYFQVVFGFFKFFFLLCNNSAAFGSVQLYSGSGCIHPSLFSTVSCKPLFVPHLRSR